MSVFSIIEVLLRLPKQTKIDKAMRTFQRLTRAWTTQQNVAFLQYYTEGLIMIIPYPDARFGDLFLQYYSLNFQRNFENGFLKLWVQFVHRHVKTTRDIELC